MSSPLNTIPQTQATTMSDPVQNNTAPTDHYKPKPVAYKDSISHPINVSWIIPPWISALLQQDMSVPDNLFMIPFAQREAEAIHKMGASEDAVVRAKKIYPHWRPRGNLGLSSCPGKKVRLDGPVNGRAKIVRDLDLDFDRLQSLGFTRVICCLFDEELELLGSPFPKYVEAANSHGIDVIRIPMVEGSTPYSFEEIDRVLDKMDETTRNGQNVLAHCRGGVGRAAVVACCWLLRLRYFRDHREVIEWVRAQRSPKAIETKEQAQFVAGYHLWTLGGENRASSQIYETQIKRRIDWSEPNMAQARKEAVLMNNLGQQSILPQEQRTDHPRQYQHQQEQQQPAQLQPHHSQHQQQQQIHEPLSDHLRPTVERSQPSAASISSTATVSSQQASPVCPSSSPNTNSMQGVNGISQLGR